MFSPKKSRKNKKSNRILKKKNRKSKKGGVLEDNVLFSGHFGTKGSALDKFDSFFINILKLINEYDSNNKVTFEELESKINISLKEFDEKNKSDKINLLSKIEKMIDELSTKRV